MVAVEVWVDYENRRVVVGVVVVVVVVAGIQFRGLHYTPEAAVSFAVVPDCMRLTDNAQRRGVAWRALKQQVTFALH